MSGIVNKIKDKLTGDHSHTTGNVAGIGTGSTYDTTAGATRTTGVTAGTTNTHTHQPVGEKIKDKLHIGTGHGGTSAAAGGQHHHLIGGMDRKDSSSSSSSDEEGGKGIVGSGQQYTAIEEHTVTKDHVTTVKEHHPVERQYVTEVKEVGVRELPTRVEHLGTTEKIVEGGTTGAAAGVHHSAAAGAQTTNTSGIMTGSTAHDTTTTHELK